MSYPDTLETPAWADALASTIDGELAGGRMVRVVLPGASHPIVIEGALIHGPLLVLIDIHGGRYFIGSPVQVVVLSDPLGPVTPKAFAPEPRMTVDGTGTGGA